MGGVGRGLHERCVAHASCEMRDIELVLFGEASELRGYLRIVGDFDFHVYKGKLPGAGAVCLCKPVVSSFFCYAKLFFSEM